MDVEEQSIVEEYASSLEDLTFNSKPLINVLTMLAEENSRYASSVTKLIEERVYKVPQQHKLPSLYLLDSIIKNVGGTYLNLIAQVLVKVFVSVFEKGDEKTRKDLYKLRHTWPQYFSAKVLHDIDVNINKLDPGWPITAVPPPSPSIHVNPKFLKKAEVTAPQLPVVLPEVPKDEEKEVLLEHQKRLAELQRLQDEQLRLTEQEIQEHQLKRDLILKKQEQERKALLTQQQQLLLTLRLESELGGIGDSSENTSTKAVSTKAEMTPSTHNITASRDPRLQRQEQAPTHNNNNGAQNQRQKDNETNRTQTADPRHRDKSNFPRNNKNIERTQGLEAPINSSKRRSRSQSPLNERENKFQRHDGYPKNRDNRPDLDKHNREKRQPKRRRSLDGSESDSTREFQGDKGQLHQRGYRGRGDRGRGFRGRETGRAGRPIRDEKSQHTRGARGREDVIRHRAGHKELGDRNLTQAQREDIEPGRGPDLVKPKPLFSEQEVTALRSNNIASNENDAESAPIPQELTLEHKSVILEEAKRRLEAGHISQEQYIELIEKLAEFYELQRQQELETHNEPSSENVVGKNMIENTEIHGRPDPRNNRGGRSNRPWKRKPGDGCRQPHRDGPPRKEQRMEEPWRRDGPARINPPTGFEGPPKPSRIARLEDQRRMDRPPMERHGPPDGRPWREHESLPPHERGSPHQQQMFFEGHPPPDQEQPGRFISHNVEKMHPRHFDDQFHRDDRGHSLRVEALPVGHGRPVEHFQGPQPGHHGPPGGPGHELPPHIRPGGPGHLGEPGLPPGFHPEPGVPPGRCPGEPGLPPGRHPGEPGLPPGRHPDEPGLPTRHHPGKPGLPPGRHPEEPGLPPGRHPGEPGLPRGRLREEPGLPPGRHPEEPGLPPGRHLGEPGLLLGHRLGEPGLPPGRHPEEPGPPAGHRLGEPGLIPGQHHGEPGLHPGHRIGEPGPHPGQLLGDQVLPPGHRYGEPGLHPGQPLYPGHHLGEPGPQGLPMGPTQGPGERHHRLPHLQMPGQGSPQRHGTETPPPSIPSMTPPTPSRMAKKTVDDLFSRLVQVGIIKVAEEPINTPPRIGTPPVMQQPLVHPHPMVPHPVSSAPAIAVKGPPMAPQAPAMTPINLQKLQDMIVKSREASTVIPIIALDNTQDLKKRHPGIISMLYRGKQCSTCGLRFDGEAEAFYREHLDWHFRRNRREKDGRRIAHKQWFILLKDWLEYEEITDPEEKAHSSFFDSEKPSTDTNAMNTQVGDGSCPVLPTDTEAESVCDICQEKFEQFWEETQEEWHYKEAIRVGGKTYHEVCYQDAKSNVEGTATEADANIGNPESEEEPDDVPEVKKEIPEVKKEIPEVKKEDSAVETKETTEAAVEKKVDLSIVKVEGVKSSEPECSESGNDKSGALPQSNITVEPEVKVKIEDTENTDSEIKIKDENKGDTNGESTNSVIKSNTTDSK